MSRRSLFVPVALAAGLAFSSPAHAERGGPDAAGYTFVDSAEPDGPDFAWIDITTTGTLVGGLADDNSVALSLGTLRFPFYEGAFTSARLGSNGWLAFDGTTNIASCFPTIPTVGGQGGEFIAALTTDLNFTGAGNPGRVYTLDDVANARFIIAFVDVPYWSVSAPGWSGAVSFQVILHASGEIVVQYGSLSAFANNAACIDVAVGVEGRGGAAGLAYRSDAIPPSNTAVRYSPPGPLDFGPSTRALVDVNGGTLLRGDEIEVVVTLAHASALTPTAVTLRDVVPVGTTFVPGSIRIDDATPTDAAGDDAAEHDAANMHVVARVGAGANATTGGALAPGASVTVRYRVVVDPEALDVISSGTEDEIAYAQGVARTARADGDPETPGAQPATLPIDLDADDDGVADDDERAASLDPSDPDSDHDGLFDGTELGQSCSLPTTDAAAGHCVADGDGGATTTNPLLADTDGGGAIDGDEDTDHDGVVDDGERNPLDPSDDLPGEDAGVEDAGVADAGSTPGPEGDGCGCATPGYRARRTEASWVAVLLVLALALAARRRRPWRP